MDIAVPVFALLIVVLVVAGIFVIAIVALAKHFGIGRVLGIGGTVLGVALAAAFLANVLHDSPTVRHESVAVSTGDESFSYSRTTKSKPIPSVSDPAKSGIELVPTPSDDPPSAASEGEVEGSTETTDPSAPDWLRIAETASVGDSPAVASDGPRPTEQECRNQIRDAVANHVTYYARTHGLNALARRPALITDQVLQDVVRDEYVSTSPHSFGGSQQTWYTLHQLLDYDSDVQQQLAALNERAVGDERLVVLGVGAAGVLGLLGLAFVLLKSTEPSQAKPVVAEQSTEWTIGGLQRERSNSNVSATAAVAVGVLVIVMGVWLMKGSQQDEPAKPTPLERETDPKHIPSTPKTPEGY